MKWLTSKVACQIKIEKNEHNELIHFKVCLPNEDCEKWKKWVGQVNNFVC